MFRYPPKVNRWPANYSKSSASSATANGTSAFSASILKSACSATAAGRKASNRKPAPLQTIAINTAASTKRSTSSAPRGEFTIPMERGAKPSPLDQHLHGGLAHSGTLRLALPALVHQLRLPRRLRRARQGHVGVGRHPLLRLARAGRERPAHLARRQRLDRATIDQES